MVSTDVQIYEIKRQILTCKVAKGPVVTSNVNTRLLLTASMIAIVDGIAEYLYPAVAIHSCMQQIKQTVIFTCTRCLAKIFVGTGEGAQAASIAETVCMGTESTGLQVYISTHQ